jgi:hypothetical protein
VNASLSANFFADERGQMTISLFTITSVFEETRALASDGSLGFDAIWQTGGNLRLTSVPPILTRSSSTEGRTPSHHRRSHSTKPHRHHYGHL